jgi:hypothetical protein
VEGKKTSFCKQKEAKKLYDLDNACGDVRATCNRLGEQKFFASFFQKRSASFPSP